MALETSAGDTKEETGFRFDISNLNYQHIHVHIAYTRVWSLMMAYEATTSLKQPPRSNLASDLKSETPITYLSMCILII